MMERVAALHGTLLVIGRDAAHVSIFPEPLQVKRATLVLAKGNAGHGTYPHVLRLMAAGRIDPRPMITAKYAFADIATAQQRSTPHARADTERFSSTSNRSLSGAGRSPCTPATLIRTACHRPPVVIGARQNRSRTVSLSSACRMNSLSSGVHSGSMGAWTTRCSNVRASSRRPPAISTSARHDKAKRLSGL